MPHGRTILMTPGPTLEDPDVLLALSRPTINHVSPEFDDVQRESLEMLRRVFNTRGGVVILPGSGTSAMELALRSVVKPGSRVLVLRAGYFGDYFVNGVKLLGGEPVVVKSDVGSGFTAGELDRLLEKNRDVEAVAFQHVETSTSVANPVQELARTAKSWGVPVVVDGVASVGGIEVRMDEWGVDVCFTGSQKALSVPPGLALVAYSESYTRELERRGGQWSLYFNLPELLKAMESSRNYYITPAVNMVYALREALRIVMAEGLENRYKRHKVMGEAVRAAIEALGLKLVAKPGFQADTVTAAYIPEGATWEGLYREMRARGVEPAGGLGELRGRIFRIGHMGQVGYSEIAATIAALERSLKALGVNVRLGAGLTALQETLARHGV